MKLKELLGFIERNQKIIVSHSPFGEEYKGYRGQLNQHNNDMLEREVDVIYTDQDTYSKEYLKIRVRKQEGTNDSD